MQTHFKNTAFFIKNFFIAQISCGTLDSFFVHPEVITIQNIMQMLLTYLFIYLFIHLFIYLFIYSFIHLQTIKRIVHGLIYINQQRSIKLKCLTSTHNIKFLVLPN